MRFLFKTFMIFLILMFGGVCMVITYDMQAANLIVMFAMCGAIVAVVKYKPKKKDNTISTEIKLNKSNETDRLS